MGILKWFRKRVDPSVDSAIKRMQARYSKKIWRDGTYLRDDNNRFAGFVLPNSHPLASAYLSPNGLKNLSPNELILKIAGPAYDAMKDGIISRKMVDVLGVYVHQRDFFMVPTDDGTAVWLYFPMDIYESVTKM